ncbi:sensor domain-containing protein [Bacillus fonticola]|uniref:sensor domain-containing protein n=1 Tax=Bacillus fonticola TaxID=2728853 RepID=UPI001D15CB46|nr:bifunctional diguanylate cyclase/phosphodiesterase [Bacillus fonticola]
MIDFLQEKMKGFYRQESSSQAADCNLTKERIGVIDGLFSHHPDAIFLLDIDGNMHYFNHAVKMIFGYSHQDLRQHFLDYIVEEERESGIAFFRKVLHGSAHNYQVVVTHTNGTRMNVDVTGIPVFTVKRQICGVCILAKDITVDVQNRKDLVKLKDNLESAQQVANIGSWDYDRLENEFFWSNQTYRLFSIDPTSAFVPTYEDILERVHPEDRRYTDDQFRQSAARCESFDFEFRVIRTDGTTIHVYARGDAILDENRKAVRFIGTIQDITLRKEAEIKLKESEQRFKNIYNNLEVGIWSFNVKENDYFLVSPGIESVTGYSPEAFQNGLPWESIVYPKDVSAYLTNQTHLEKGEAIFHSYRIRTKSGELRWVQDRTLPVHDVSGNLIRIDGIITDITEQKNIEEQMTYFAYHDYLTDLPNRRMFDEKIEELLTSEQPFAMMYLDLDRFTTINNALAHSIGDKVLRQFGERMTKLLDHSSLFARMGGDEFAILIWNIRDKNKPINLARTIIDRMKTPFTIDDFDIYLTTSVGISLFPEDGKTKKDLVKHADAALYRAKENGKNNYQIFSASLNIESYKSFVLERDLRKALQKEQFILHFQPRVNAITGEVITAEALIRWNHPEWGLISPNEFIPLAEENGFIVEVGDWVVKQVCRCISSWKNQGHQVVPISINVSAQSFLTKDWVASIIQAVQKDQVDPQLLEFEITESVLIEHEEVVFDAIHTLQEMGVRFALDDFGTGYSSLTYLRKFPIDTIKMDRSFIQNSTEFERDKKIITAIIFLAKSLDMRVVAEGVETIEQFTFLRQQKCDEIQGYLFSKPVDEREFQRLLAQGILYPGKRHQDIEVHVERRKYERISLPFPLGAGMSLLSIHNKKVELGQTNVLLENICPKGVKFLSTIDLPVRPDLILQFETLIMGKNVLLKGHPIWKHDSKDLFLYGVELMTTEGERADLEELLNEFSHQIEMAPLVPESNFVQIGRVDYFKKM